jgi:hypothetical protein
MAFALTSFRSYGVYIDEPITKRAVQYVHMTITALGADVDLDVGDAAGTFWTAAVADATHGTNAAKAKTAWVEILSKAKAIASMQSFEISKSKTPCGASAVGAGLVKINGTALAPEILFHTAEGITALTLNFVIELKDEHAPVRLSY